MMEGWTIINRVLSLLHNVVILMKRFTPSGQLMIVFHFINMTTIRKRQIVLNISSVILCTFF